jgi:type I restriction enzyme M protein
MILHNNPTALIEQGNTLTDPKFKDGDTLKTFDFVVANPPFSDKRWSTGLDPANDTYERFQPFGTPPDRQGDYAYLLHIVRSLKTTGTGACILPHGVLFRGNAEADIRRNLVRKGYVRGIIGLPANLFYGTGIPACIVVVDKKDAQARKGIFMIDARHGFMKDGPKNRLRAQDIHKIVDVFTRNLEIDGYSKMVSFEEIEKNEFNLNLPRYIDSQTAEDLQDIAGHLQGGIPEADVDALAPYWEVCPGLRKALFKPNRDGYADLAVEKTAIKSTIFGHPQFTAFVEGMNFHFATWRKKNAATLKALEPGFHPREVISVLSEDLLAHYANKPLIDPYDIYQHLMDYSAETMQDDCYLIAADGWVGGAKVREVLQVKNKEGKLVWPKGHDFLLGKRRFKSDLVPGSVLIGRFFQAERGALDALVTQLTPVDRELAEQMEEQGVEGGLLDEVTDVDGGKRKITTKNVKAWLKENKGETSLAEELEAVTSYGKLLETQAGLKSEIRVATGALHAAMAAKYTALAESETKTLVVDDKWLTTLDGAVRDEIDRVGQRLTERVKELAERYETPLPETRNRVVELEARVNNHLEVMGFTWK